MTITQNSLAAGRAIVDLRLPDDFLVVLIARNNEFLVPSGGTLLLAGDRLLVLSEQESMRRVEAQRVAPSADGRATGGRSPAVMGSNLARVRHL